MSEDNKASRLFQPNLVCSFDLTKNDDQSIWTLVIRNHEKAGICDEQMVSQLWQFTNIFTKRLIEQKLWDLKEGQPVPPANAIVTHCSRYIMYNIIVATEEGLPLTPPMVMLILGELSKNIAEQFNFKLEGLHNGAKRQAPYASRN